MKTETWILFGLVLLVLYVLFRRSQKATVTLGNIVSAPQFSANLTPSSAPSPAVEDLLKTYPVP